MITSVHHVGCISIALDSLVDRVTSLYTCSFVHTMRVRVSMIASYPQSSVHVATQQPPPLFCRGVFVDENSPNPFPP
jgi:hypothetical protein